MKEVPRPGSKRYGVGEDTVLPACPVKSCVPLSGADLPLTRQPQEPSGLTKHPTSRDCTRKTGTCKDPAESRSASQRRATQPSLHKGPGALAYSSVSVSRYLTSPLTGKENASVRASATSRKGNAMRPCIPDVCAPEYLRKQNNPKGRMYTLMTRRGASPTLRGERVRYTIRKDRQDADPSGGAPPSRHASSLFSGRCILESLFVQVIPSPLV